MFKYIILFFLLLHISVKSELIDSIFVLKQIITIEDSISNPKNFIVKLSENKVFIINNQSITDGENNYFNLLIDKCKYRLIINDTLINNIINRYKNITVYDFVVIDNRIFLLGGRLLLCFNYQDNNYILDKYLELPNLFLYLKYFKDNIYLYNCFKSTLPKAFSNTFILKYNILNGDTLIHYFKNPKGYDYTFLQPRQLIDFCENQLIISDANEYRIQVVDSNFKEIQILNRNPDKWIAESKKNDSNSIKKENKKKDMFEDLFNISLIQRVNFIDANRILVSWTYPLNKKENKINIVYDLWEKTNNIWSIKYCDLYNDKEMDSNSIVNLNAFLRTNRKYFITDEKMTNLLYFPFKINELKSIKYKDFINKYNNYLSEEMPFYSLIIREIQ